MPVEDTDPYAEHDDERPDLEDAPDLPGDQNGSSVVRVACTSRPTADNASMPSRRSANSGCSGSSRISYNSSAVMPAWANIAAASSLPPCSVSPERQKATPDPADRMIGRDQVLGRQGRQHRQLRVRCTTHPPILFDFDAEREHLSRISAPC